MKIPPRILYRKDGLLNSEGQKVSRRIIAYMKPLVEELHNEGYFVRDIVFIMFLNLTTLSAEMTLRDSMNQYQGE